MVPGDDELEKTRIVTSDTFKGRMRAADEAPPSFVVLMGPTGYVGKQFPITTPELLVGRSVDSHIFIDDPSVSRSHARVLVNGSEVSLMDLGSSNKTMVNSRELIPMKPVILANNDQIKAGNVIMKFLEKGNIEAVANRELNEKAQKDALTGAYSKGALLEKGPEAIKRSEILNEELSVLVFDLDFFKKINDTYGHAAGDYVLKELSRIISTKMIRGNDFFARYGGEEFVIILPGANIKTSIEVAERIRSTIEGTEFVHEGRKMPVTVSLGAGSRQPNETDWESFFNRVDEAAYKSKQLGRNRVSAAN